MDKQEYEKKLLQLIELSMKREEQFADLLNELKKVVSALEEKSK